MSTAGLTREVRRKTPVPLGARDRDIAQGSCASCLRSFGWLFFDGEQVMGSALFYQILGVVPLAVHRIGRDQRSEQLDVVQKRGEHGDLVGLEGDVELS